MKKLLFAIVMISIFLTLSAAQKQKDSAADQMKNLQIIAETEAVPAKAKSGYDSICAKDLMTFMAFLSSDHLEGREIGTRGYDTAAAYAQSLFALWGLTPGGDMSRPVSGPFEPGKALPKPERGYLQEFAMKEALETTAVVVLETDSGQSRTTRRFAPGVDFIFSSFLPLEVSAPVVFAGYGIGEKEIAYNDLAAVDVRDKIVMILSEAPGKDDPASPFQKKELKEKYFPATPAFRGSGIDFAKVSAIFKRGALAVLVVKNDVSTSGDIHGEILGQRQVRDDKPILPDERKKLLIPGSKGMPWEGRTMVRISREMADAILERSGETVDGLRRKIAAKYTPHSFVLKGASLHLSNQVRYGLLKSANVVGYIEGSDPQLKGEAVVIGGHLDHLGRRGDYIYNGAEDNGSGACGVLAMARALALNPEKPKRSMVFCLWTGEEEGLLGSRWYVEHPLFSMERTLAYLNLDMIALPWGEKSLKRMTRMLGVDGDELLKKIKPENFLSLSVAEQSPELREALLAANRSVGFDILYRESPPRPDRMSGGSDHSSFAKAGKPWVFFMSGMGDNYHTPADSMEKFSGATMEKMSRLVYLAAYLLADR
ncbi:MAG: M20/M25/M40 family metallo-hydrolase [Acidobacteriota bacterium]|nr:M20/M25/M40 family metallo-hydrolase [Acidobacteriota bacterium]